MQGPKAYRRLARKRRPARGGGAEHVPERIVSAWTRSGCLAGALIGGAYGTALVPVFGTIVGAFIGLIAGLAVGIIDGLLLAWLRPAPGHVPLAAAVTTEQILLPVQVWLWSVIHTIAFLPVVAAPSVVSVGVAALLGRRLPPGAGSRTA
jgi:hypothetical protein